MESGVGVQLPRYQCHKKVWALKILVVIPLEDGTLRLVPENENYAPFVVPVKYVPKHEAAGPRTGWYWVRYEDGYESFSPPEPFEEGYTIIT